LLKKEKFEKYASLRFPELSVANRLAPDNRVFEVGGASAPGNLDELVIIWS